MLKQEQEKPNEIFGALVNLKATMASDRMTQAITDSTPVSMAKYLTPERVGRILAAAASRQPELLKCTKKSLIAAVIAAVQLGLEPGGPLGHAYLVPFFSKGIGVSEATLIIGYQGYIALARRSGELESVFAQVIYSRDHYRIQYGDNPKIEHEPYIPDPERADAPQDRGKPVAGYCVARYKDGGYHKEVMTVGEIEAIRKRSRAKSGPWFTDWEMMARKTVIRRARHYWPLSVEMASAFEADDRALVSLEDALGEARAAALEEGSKTERLKAELTGKEVAKAHAEGKKEDPPAEEPETDGGREPTVEELAEADAAAQEQAQATLDGAGF